MSSCPDNDVSRMATLCAACVVTLRVLAAVCGIAISAAPTGAQGVLSVLVPTVSLGGAYILFRYLAEMMPFGALIEEQTAVRHVRLCLLFCGAAAGSMLAARALAAVFGISAGAEVPTGAPLLWYALVNCALAPILEERLFRGIMLRYLMPFGGTLAVAGTAALFAFAHADAVRWPAALLCGAALGICAVKTRSLRLCTALHVLYNSAQLVMLCRGYVPPVLMLAAVFIVGVVQIKPCMLNFDSAAKSAVLKRFFLAPAMLALCALAVAEQFL